jgi:hypothetical protein
MKKLTAAQFLEKLFETDPASDEYAALCYQEVGLGLGTKPWWEPFSEIWANRDLPAEEACPNNPHAWRDALALLERVHADYEAHRRRKS